MALGDMDVHSAWQAWHLRHLVARLVPSGRRGPRGCLCGRRGTWRHLPSLCVASVALTGSGGALGSQWTPRSPRMFAWPAWHLATSAFTLRGRRGTWRHRPPLCVASVALMALDWLWWSAWFPVDAAVAAPVCVAGVALGDICLHFAWQAWHLATSAFTLRGRRGTWRHGPPLCMAGVTILHGRCNNYGTWWRAWFPVDAAVAGVALGDICLHSAWQAWDLATWTSALRGRRGTWRHRPPVWVAGVALGDIHLGFAWQVCMALGDIRAASESISLKYDFVTHNFVTHNLSHLSLTCNFIAHNFVKHNSFAHNFFTHISLTRNFVTHNFVTHTHNLSHTSLSHATSLSHTHIFVTHNFVTHTQLCHTHTTLSHTTLCHFVTDNLSHTTLSQLILSYTTLSHTHNFVTHNLSHTHTTLSLTTFHTQLFYTQLCHTQLFTYNP